MRPSSISLSSARRATSRRSGSNDERTTACGVSSMMKSTPVRCSSAADVPSLAADDPPLQVVGGELDDGHGRLGGMACRDALQRVRHERTCAAACVRARLLLHLTDFTGQLVADEVLRSLDQLLPGFVHCQPGDLLQRAECFPMRLAKLLLQLLDVDLAVTETLVLALELRQASVDLELLLEYPLLDLRDLDAAVLDLALDLAAQRDGLLACVHLCLSPRRLSLSLGVREQPLGLVPCDAHTRARAHEQDDRRRGGADEDSDERCADREHEASSGGCRCPRCRRGCSHPAVDPHGSPPDSARTSTSGGRASSVVG